MANTTDPFAQTVHGTNPQFLIEKITRLKIYNATYWKEQCFGLTAETLIEKAASLKYIGGTYGGNIRPTNFLCLVLKMLQLQPELDIVLEYINQEDFKYVRALGAFYLRLTGRTEDIYNYLEPLYDDFRKLSYRGVGGWSVCHMDEFIDNLLREELVCDVALPHLVKRFKLEELGTLEMRESTLDIEADEEADNDEIDETDNNKEQITLQQGTLTNSNGVDNNNAITFSDDESDNNENEVAKTKAHVVDVSVDNAPSKVNQVSPRDNLQTHEKHVNGDKTNTDNSKRDDNDSHVNKKDKDDDRHRDDSDRRRYDSRDRYTSNKNSSRRRDYSSDDSHRSNSRDSRDKHRRKETRYDSRDRRSRRGGGRSRRSRSRSRSYDSYDSRDRKRNSNRRSRYDSRDRRRKHDDDDDYDGNSRRRDSRRDRSYDNSRDNNQRRRHRSYSRDSDYKSHNDKYNNKSKYDKNDDDRDGDYDRKDKYSSDISNKRRYDDNNDNERSNKISKYNDDDDNNNNNNKSNTTKKHNPDEDEIYETTTTTTATSKTKDKEKVKAEKKFDRIFGKKQAGKEIVNDKGQKVLITAPEGSVEYWNQIRESLGMKKLK